MKRRRRREENDTGNRTNPSELKLDKSERRGAEEEAIRVPGALLTLNDKVGEEGAVGFPPPSSRGSSPRPGGDLTSSMLRERSEHRPRPLAYPPPLGRSLPPVQPMYAVPMGTGTSPMLQGPPGPSLQAVRAALTPPVHVPYDFRSPTSAAPVSTDSSSRPYELHRRWTQAQRDQRILDHVRQVVSHLRVDLGFIATALRVQFGVEFLQKPNPHPCLDPGLPASYRPFNPQQRPWDQVPDAHFAEYAAQLWQRMKASQSSPTQGQAGRISTLIEEVIMEYMDLKELMSEGASILPPTDSGPYMTCIIERALRYMLFCRMMTQYGHVLDTDIMAMWAPSGQGEPPHAHFHNKTPFGGIEVPALMGFPGMRTFRDHYGTFYNIPAGYPKGGGFAPPGRTSCPGRLSPIQGRRDGHRRPRTCYG